MANLFVIYMRKQEEEAAGKNGKWWSRWLSARLQYLVALEILQSCTKPLIWDGVNEAISAGSLVSKFSRIV